LLGGVRRPRPSPECVNGGVGAREHIDEGEGWAVGGFVREVDVRESVGIRRLTCGLVEESASRPAAEASSEAEIAAASFEKPAGSSGSVAALATAALGSAAAVGW
jgi:hypothetical protein